MIPYNDYTFAILEHFPRIRGDDPVPIVLLSRST